MKYIRVPKKSNKASKTTQMSVIKSFLPPPSWKPTGTEYTSKKKSEKKLPLANGNNKQTLQTKQDGTYKNKAIQGISMNNNMTIYH